jgi:TonB-linked SusC/RagA family outer membrane protein
MKRSVRQLNKMMVCSLLLTFTLIQLGYATSLKAQFLSSASGFQAAGATYYKVSEHSGSIKELQNTISLRMSDATLAEVLSEIARQSNLGIAYRSNLPMLKNVIDADFNGVSTADALMNVLSGTGYEAAISKTREILLLRVAPAPVEVARVVKQISGQVVDAATGDPLPTVNVFVKGTTIGTSTDMDGRYSLTVPDDAATLVFSFVGYKTQEIAIGAGGTLNVSLEPDLVALEDLVVVGYGTQQRTEVTGSVVSIRSEQIQNVPVSSFESALQGRLAGVNVSESTGEPGSSPQVTIRGTGSISAGNEPLYVIDGVPITKNTDLQPGLAQQTNKTFQPPKVNPLATINPNDIESIEVLKDASAAAIYGSRGSNGVIIITTKKGVAGKPRVTFNSYAGVSTVFNEPALMNSEELIAYTKDSRNNNYLQSLNPTDPASANYNPQYDPNTNAGRPNNTNYLIPVKYVNWDGTDTDWLDLVLGSATMQNYDLSVSGGTQNSTYFFSSGYLTQEGIIEGSKFDRYTVKVNLGHTLSDRFKVGLGVNAALTQHDRLPANSPYFGTPPGIIYSALVHSPVIKPYNDDGTINQRDNTSHLGGGTTTASNPLAIMKYISEDIKNSRVFGNLFGEYSVNENLTFKSLLGYDVENYQQNYYQGTEFLYRNQTTGNPYGQASAADAFNWVWENTLNYVTTFGTDHSLNVVAGYTAQKQQDNKMYVVAQKYPDDQVSTINGGLLTGASQTKEEWSLVSALGRVNYAYKQRYLLTGTLRSDRSSRFGADNQTGIFPSVSLGWRMTEEEFMKGAELFNEMKVRLSYGVTGNFLIPNYGSIGLLGESNYPMGGSEKNGTAPVTFGNSELTWETTYQTNAGLDFAMLNDRIYGSVDAYSSRTKDLLLFVTIPASTGFTTALQNIGEVSNKGFEFAFTTRNTVGDFQWATDFNFARNVNEVTKLGPEGDPILSAGAAGTRHITMIGEEIGSYYGYVVEGVFQNQAEINAAPVDKLAPARRPGDFRFKDVNGDGQITTADRTVIGSYHPDFTYGITNRFNYRNFDLSVFIQGVEGREIMNLTTRHLLNGEANFNSYAALNDRWISESQPGNGEHPRADRESAKHGNNNRESSYQVMDGSYLKIKSLTMGYNLPASLLQDRLSRARVYLSVNNLAIFTDYIGFNPEVSLQAGSSLTPGEDYGAYPLSRTIQLGVDIAF